MLECIHQHIMEELSQGAKTDTVVVVTAVFFDLIILAINSATSAGRGVTGTLCFSVFILMTIMINSVCIAALRTNRDSRITLLQGLLMMYRDEHVDQYYKPSLLENYSRRYQYFTTVLIGLASIAILIPLLLRISSH